MKLDMSMEKLGLLVKKKVFSGQKFLFKIIQKILFKVIDFPVEILKFSIKISSFSIEIARFFKNLQ